MVSPRVKRIIIAVFIDVLCLILAILPAAVLEFVSIPFHRGYFCDDDSIKYQYYDDTITDAMLFTIGLGVPILTIVLRETLYYYCHKRNSPKRSGSLPPFVVACYKNIGVFLFGCAVSQSITQIGKFSVGRLRPHFLDVCRPNVTDDRSCLSPENLYQYVDDIICTGTNKALLLDARLSFPSGHASMSTYWAIFIVLYLQAQFKWIRSKLLRHFLQAAAIYAAIFVCLSRITDNKHHWSDVLSGAVIGVLTAALTCIHISDMFSRRKLPVPDTSSLFFTENSVINIAAIEISEPTVRIPIDTRLDTET